MVKEPKLLQILVIFQEKDSMDAMINDINMIIFTNTCYFLGERIHGCHE